MVSPHSFENDLSNFWDGEAGCLNIALREFPRSLHVLHSVLHLVHVNVLMPPRDPPNAPLTFQL